MGVLGPAKSAEGNKVSFKIHPRISNFETPARIHEGRRKRVEMVFDNYIHFEHNNFLGQEIDAKVLLENIHHLVSLNILTSRYWR